MSALVVAYIEQLAEGFEPSPDSEEAKAYRSWSWAYEKLRRIQASVDWEIGFMAEAMEEENGEMYR